MSMILVTIVKACLHGGEFLLARNLYAEKVATRGLRQLPNVNLFDTSYLDDTT